MLTINSQVLSRTANQLRSLLGLPRQSTQSVTLSAASDGTTTLACQKEECAVACQLAIANPAQSLSLPLCLLQDLHASPAHDVRFQALDGRVQVDYWQPTPAVRSGCLWQAAETPQPPELAEYWLDNPPELLWALYAAAALADDSSSRYALHCLRLRGRDGQLAVTDGRQALIHWGFALPLDEVLLPAAGLVRLKGLLKCDRLEVGCTPEWLQLRLQVGLARWWLAWRLSPEGRFPTIDQCFGDTQASQTIVTIDEADAQWLIEQLPRALGTRQSAAVTLELSRQRGWDTSSADGRPQCHLRFRCDQPRWLLWQGLEPADEPGTSGTPVELLLSGSGYEGAERRVAVSHLHLLQGLRLGFRQFHLPARPAPVLCCQPGRKFTFSLLNDQLALHAGSGQHQLETARDRVAA